MRIHSVVIGLLATASVSAADLTEVEFNHPINASQYVQILSDPTSIAAELGNGGAGDLDYYTFFGREGEVVTLDIDGGYGGQQSVDTAIAIFGAGPNYPILRANDDAVSVDVGSTSRLDSRIDNFVLPATGTYIVGVSNYPRLFLNGGGVRAGTARQGDYTLVISGVAPQVLPVALEVKPGDTDIAPVNPKSRGKLPVAILGNVDVDVNQLDLESLTFGATGDEASFVRCNEADVDVNGDGRPDRICHFENQAAGFGAGDEEGIMRGRLLDGRLIEGRGWLKVVPEKQLH